MSDVRCNDSTVVQAATQAAVQAPSHAGYLFLEERCSGQLDPRNDVPIDFVPVEARCSEMRPEEMVP